MGIPFIGELDLTHEAMGLVLVAGFLLWLFLSTAFLPLLIASGRRTKNRGTVAVINVLFGFTVIGWIVALLMSLSSNVDPPTYVETRPKPTKPPTAKPKKVPQSNEEREHESSRSWRRLVGVVSVAAAIGLGALVIVALQDDSLPETSAVDEVTTPDVATTSAVLTTTTTAITTTTKTLAAVTEYASTASLPYERLDLLPYRGFHECSIVGTFAASDGTELDMEACSGEMAFDSNEFHVWHGYLASEGQTSDDLRSAGTEFILLLDGKWVEPDGFIEDSGGSAALLPYFIFDGLSGQHNLVGIWFFEGTEQVISDTVVNFP